MLPVLQVEFDDVQAEEACVALVLVVEADDASVVEEGEMDVPDGPVRKTGR